MLRLFSNRRLLSLTIILIVSNLIVTGITIWVIYNKSISSIEASLIDVVERQNSLVNTLHEQGKSEQEIIQFIKIMREKHYGIGEHGEFAIATKVGDSANYLMLPKNAPHLFIKNAENHGLPMRYAFQGKKGGVIAEDYNGTTVIAGYTYVPALKWGIVAKIPISEVNKPYYLAGIIALLISVLLIIFCVLLFVKISNPIIKEIVINEEKFSRSVKFSPFPIMIHAEDGEVMNISKGWTDITGYTLIDIPTIEEWTLRAYGERKFVVKEYIDTLYRLDDSKDDGEYTINCKNGTKRIWDFSSAPLGKLSDGRRAVISIAKDVTERKQAELQILEKSNEIEAQNEEFRQINEELFNAKEQHEESEEKYRALYNNAPLSYQSLNEDGCFIDINPMWSKTLGYDRDEVIGKWYGDFLHPDYVEHFRINFPAFKKRGYVSDVQFKLRKKDGSYIYVSFEGCIGYTPEGKFKQTYCVFKDISEQKALEQYLLKSKEKTEESEKRLRSIIENTQAGYFFIDNDGLFQNVNKAWLNLYKYDNFEEVIGRHFAVVQQIDDMESAKQFVEGIRNGNPAFMNGDFSRLCKDKSIGYHTFSARPVYVNNEIIGIEGFIIDITKQKEIEKELISSKDIAERNEKKFRSLFTSMQEGVYLHEIIYDNLGKAVNYRIIECNPSSEKYLNIKRENAIGKLATELFGTSDAPFLDIYAQVAETAEPISFEQYFEPMDKYFLISVFSPKKGEFATAFLDITKNKNYEIELISAKEKAEESDRLKTAFLQNMSHEIRTPMNAIMGFSGLIVNNYNNKAKLEKFSEIINLRCNDLLDIVNDILDIAKIESGQLSVNFEECNLNALFAELTQFYREHQKRIGKQQITFNLQVQCDPSDGIIETDKVKLKQIFINLISNAFKFTESGTIEGGCKYDVNRNLLFYVSDTGIGIPPDKQEFIFERFAQVEKGSNRLYGGTGLGLSIVKGLTSLLGGEIFLQSEFGKGSTFSFTIPYKAATALHHEPVLNEKTEKNNFTNKTILIVEDDLYNTQYIRELLTNINLNILQTEYGKEAVEISISQPVDLVLMDIRLPDIDGYEATRQIRQHKAQLKIIAQTAYASHDERQKALDAGCNDYISKPTKSDLLLAMINKHLMQDCTS